MSDRPSIEITGPNGILAVARRRLRARWIELVTPVMQPLGDRGRAAFGNHAKTDAWLLRVPRQPRALARRRFRELRPWRPHRRTPDGLRRGPGIERDRQVELETHAKAPLHNHIRVHVEAYNFIRGHNWNWLLPSLAWVVQGLHRLDHPARRREHARVDDPEEVTATIRRLATELGLSTVGFAPYDPVYTFAEHAPEAPLPNVVVCIVEQDWAATQSIPSGRGERAAFRAYAQLMEGVSKLADAIRELGYDTHATSFAGEAMAIPAAVAAGLGQLGLNGQLLTPQAGSRCRLALIATDAPVVLGQPVDYGIEAICDSCKACVRRCPSGAIPASRKMHRGVVKAKIKTERCMPTMAQTNGCAVCMKVCPVQRYGLEAVHEHWERTGTVLGVGTDELEGYEWPLDGRFYGAGDKPRVTDDLIRPEGFHYDPDRTAPPAHVDADRAAAVP